MAPNSETARADDDAPSAQRPALFRPSAALSDEAGATEPWAFDAEQARKRARFVAARSTHIRACVVHLSQQEFEEPRFLESECASCRLFSWFGFDEMHALLSCLLLHCAPDRKTSAGSERESGASILCLRATCSYMNKAIVFPGSSIAAEAALRVSSSGVSRPSTTDVCSNPFSYLSLYLSAEKEARDISMYFSYKDRDILHCAGACCAPAREHAKSVRGAGTCQVAMLSCPDWSSGHSSSADLTDTATPKFAAITSSSRFSRFPFFCEVLPAGKLLPRSLLPAPSVNPSLDTECVHLLDASSPARGLPGESNPNTSVFTSSFSSDYPCVSCSNADKSLFAGFYVYHYRIRNNRETPYFRSYLCVFERRENGFEAIYKQSATPTIDCKHDRADFGNWVITEMFFTGNDLFAFWKTDATLSGRVDRTVWCRKGLPKSTCAVQYLAASGYAESVEHSLDIYAYKIFKCEVGPYHFRNFCPTRDGAEFTVEMTRADPSGFLTSMGGGSNSSEFYTASFKDACILLFSFSSTPCANGLRCTLVASVDDYRDRAARPSNRSFKLCSGISPNGDYVLFSCMDREERISEEAVVHVFERSIAPTENSQSPTLFRWNRHMMRSEGEEFVAASLLKADLETDRINTEKDVISYHGKIVLRDDRPWICGISCFFFSPTGSVALLATRQVRRLWHTYQRGVEPDRSVSVAGGVEGYAVLDFSKLHFLYLEQTDGLPTRVSTSGLVRVARCGVNYGVCQGVSVKEPADRHNGLDKESNVRFAWTAEGIYASVPGGVVFLSSDASAASRPRDVRDKR